MKTVLFIALLFIYAAAVNAQTTISTKDAKDHIGENAVVSGKVFDVFTSAKGRTLINFDDKYPNQTFTVVVNETSSVDISAIKAGSILTISGMIKSFKDKPEIILETQEQIVKVE